MLKGEEIVCFGLADWDAPYRTNQHHILSRLSSMNRVLFIESLGLRRPVLQKKDIFRAAKRIKDWMKGLRQITPSLYVYSPLLLPYHGSKAIRWINHRSLLPSIKTTLKRIGFNAPILLTYSPNGASFVGRLGEKLSVYYCVDELSSSPMIPTRAVKEMESELLAKVDIVFTSSIPLFQRKRKVNPNTFYISNGVDPLFLDKEKEVPEDLRRISPPIIGFIGAISDYKLDLSFILYIARSRPEWSIVMIGGTGEGEKGIDLSIFKRVPNIHILGRRPQRALPSYLGGFDVCILPSKLNEYTRNMFPIKFFEYMSSGKPLVAIDLPSLKEYRDYFYPVKEKEEFIKAIEVALNEDGSLARRRIALAKENTWERRVEEISGIIEERLKG
jgi:glycosyltransferase involved in cell wall biosynthesis